MIAFANPYPTITTVDGQRCRVDGIGLLGFRRRLQPYPPPTREQIAMAMAWLGRVDRIKTPQFYSYSAKHAVERWLRLGGHPQWIPNGAMIVAADRLGFRQAVSSWSHNTNIAISLRSYHKLPESSYQMDRRSEVWL